MWQLDWKDWLSIIQDSSPNPGRNLGSGLALGHRNFLDPAWNEKPFSQIRDLFFLYKKRFLDLLEGLEGFSEEQKKQMIFWGNQVLDALSPSNTLLSNPQILKKTFESEGKNLWQGIQNFLKDYQKSPDIFKISLSDPDAFSIGKNLATTAGAVIHRNRICELIQYEAQTEKVNEIPILIVPPWINKYYILDLSPQTSLVKWLVEQGFTVFMISWVNPDESYRDAGFSDYLNFGILESLKIIKSIINTNSNKKIRTCHALGFCIGGTLLASAAAYLDTLGKNKSKLFESLTYLTTFLDFSKPGDLGIFINPESVQLMKTQMSVKGYLDGRILANIFSLLRANDLIWSFVINNYLLGNIPAAFDLLHWNGDSSNLPYRLHAFCLEALYLNNDLLAGRVKINGQFLDLKKIKIPSYFLATELDHIAPWQSVYAGALQYGEDSSHSHKNSRFVLAGSGHIAGVVNPPHRNKYGYKLGLLPCAAGADLKNPEHWHKIAEYHTGSWWPNWRDWLLGLNPGAGSVPARALGNPDFPVLLAAPGQYVLKSL
ncbi:MAG: PHA/PHB synthase family protein [Gammaproteobacteria bacterium]